MFDKLKRILLTRDGILRPSVFFLVPALFYGFSAARSPLWLDATLILDSARSLTLSAWVNIHNLFNVLGFLWLRLFAWVDPCHALTLLAALFGALTVLFFYLIFLEFRRGPFFPAAAALAVMLSHSLWWHSSIIEVYTLNAFLISVMLLALLRWETRGNSGYLALAFGALGFGVSNHVLMGLFVPAFAVLPAWMRFVRKRRIGGRALLLAALCLAAGGGLYAFVFLRDVAGNMGPSTGFAEAFGRTWLKATGGEFRDYMFTEGLSRSEMRFWRWNYPFLWLMNFPSAAILLGFYGLVRWVRDREVSGTLVFLLTAMAAQIIWSANYFIWDMFAFSMPVYLMFGVLAGYGLCRLAGTGRKGRLLAFIAVPTFLVPLFLYPALARSGGEGSAVRRYFAHYEVVPTVRPVWNPEPYIINPWKGGFDDVNRVIGPLLERLPEGAVLLAGDPTVDFPLKYYYRSVLGRRPDIELRSIFLPFMNERRALGTARGLLKTLESGRSVYFLSPSYPERAVLIALASLADPPVDARGLAGLDDETFIAAYDAWPLDAEDLTADGSVTLYRLCPR